MSAQVAAGGAATPSQSSPGSLLPLPQIEQVDVSQPLQVTLQLAVPPLNSPG